MNPATEQDRTVHIGDLYDLNTPMEEVSKAARAALRAAAKDPGTPLYGVTVRSVRLERASLCNTINVRLEGDALVFGDGFRTRRGEQVEKAAHALLDRYNYRRADSNSAHKFYAYVVLTNRAA